MARTIFAMELCFPFNAGLHTTLRSCILQQPYYVGHQQKWEMYRNICQVLGGGLSLAERGCWDYFADDAKAKNDFKMWVRGMLTNETARTSPSGAVDPYRGDPRYMTMTIAFLIVKGSYCDLTLAGLCDFPENELWRRDTFSRLLLGLGALNFASVERDVAYLIPRDQDWALTAQDTSEPKFEYLRAIE